MKKLVLPTFLLLTSFYSNAQMVGSNAYMKGNYVEIGINGLGGYEGVDTTLSAPFAGLHYRSNTQFFGFVSNPQMDGWGNYDGDFYSPGSPENGWGFEIMDTTSTDTIYVQGNNNMALSSSTTSTVTGAITSYSYSAGYTNVVWEGNFGSGYDIDFTLSYTLGDNDLFYTTDVTIVNNGPANIENFYFYRNIDPDNNVVLSSDYTTQNTIINQISTCCYSSVKAEQSLPWPSLFAFYTADSNARVGYGGFSNRDGSDLWNGIGFVQTVGATNFADEAVYLVYNAPNFVSFTRSSGGTPVLHYRYYTVLGSVALNNLIATTGVNEVAAIEVNLFPNPTSNVLSIQSKEIMNKLVVRDASGRMVANQNTNSSSSTIDVSALKAGIYFITIEAEKGSVTKRFVKQ